jgi:hypothetical protein
MEEYSLLTPVRVGRQDAYQPTLLGFAVLWCFLLRYIYDRACEQDNRYDTGQRVGVSGYAWS